MRQSHKRFNAHHAHVPSEENDLLIDTINSLDLGWKADTCKYQKEHANYGSHCEGLQLVQTASKEAEGEGESEAEAEGATVFGQGSEFEIALEKARSFQQKYSSAEQIPDSELPANFDWRNVHGYDFTNKHRN